MALTNNVDTVLMPGLSTCFDLVFQRMNVQGFLLITSKTNTAVGKRGSSCERQRKGQCVLLYSRVMLYTYSIVDKN